MKLTEKYQIDIPEKKIIDYILSFAHPLGKHKAKIFSKHGFTFENKDEFISEIRNLVASNPVQNRMMNQFGEKFVVDGVVKIGFNKPLKVRSIWIVLENKEIATFITIYPFS